MSSDLDSHVGLESSEAAEIEQIVHDLNNQIMVIQGNASLLRMQGTSWTDICEMADQILSASQRSSVLTKQLSQVAAKPVGSSR